MASSPTFDPSRIADPDKARAYLTSCSAPVATAQPRHAGQYVPGSVFKIITATANIGLAKSTPIRRSLNQPRPECKTGFLVQGFRYAMPRPFQTDHPLDFTEAAGSPATSVRTPGFRSGPRTCSAGPPSSASAPSRSICPPPRAGDERGGPLDGFADKVELANAAYGQGETLVAPLCDGASRFDHR
jgi:cell division protein FtsI/penicillin-binding protein 2